MSKPNRSKEKAPAQPPEITSIKPGLLTAASHARSAAVALSDAMRLRITNTVPWEEGTLIGDNPETVISQAYADLMRASESLRRVCGERTYI